MNVLVRLFIVVGILAGAVWVWRASHPLKPVPAEAVAKAEAVVSPQAAVVETPKATPAAVNDTQASAVAAATAELGDPSTGLWTSKDGRTMNGVYVSSSESAVTVRRTDGQVFVIPFEKLAESDVTWVRQQPRVAVAPVAPVAASEEATTPAVTQRDLDQIVAQFPYLPTVGGEVTNDLQQLHEKYRSMVKFMRPATIEANLKMIRSRLADDVKTLSRVAGTGSGDWSGKRGSSQSAAAEVGILSARRSVAWLEGALTEHLRAYEALMAGQK